MSHSEEEDKSSKQLAIYDGTNDNEDGGPKNKRPRITKQEQIFLDNLPSCEAYERSFMHRDIISHVRMTKTQFLITASVDGYIKFWKKTTTGIEFVKSFKSHVGPIEDISVTDGGSELASIARVDRSVKIFDIVSFDMINMFDLEFEPGCVEWADSTATGNENLLISDSQSSKIYVFDARQAGGEPKRVLNDIHDSIVCRMRLNSRYKLIVSADIKGKLELWTCRNGFYKPIRQPLLSFNELSETDLGMYEGKNDDVTGIRIHHISFTPNGQFFAITSSDRMIRVFKLKTGKLVRIFDESIGTLERNHKESPQMSIIDFARKMAIERDIEKNSMTRYENAVFDESGNFLIYPSMLGAKIWNWRNQTHLRSLGKDETNFRPLCLSLFQGLVFEKTVRRFNVDTLDSGISDPSLYCSSYKKNRFYCFSNRYFEETTSEELGGEKIEIKDRDIFNEKPSREETLAAVEVEDINRREHQSGSSYMYM